jgi:hypothetical protein
MHYGPVVDSGSNTNEQKEIFLGGKGWSARKADILTGICESIV